MANSLKQAPHVSYRTSAAIFRSPTNEMTISSDGLSNGTSFIRGVIPRAWGSPGSDAVCVVQPTKSNAQRNNNTQIFVYCLTRRIATLPFEILVSKVCFSIIRRIEACPLYCLSPSNFCSGCGCKKLHSLHRIM